jgi:hypothetical protein
LRITFREYFGALGKWIWVLIADVFGIAQDLLFDIPILNKFRLEFWITLLFAFLIIANIHAFHKVRVQRDKLRDILNDRQRVQAILTRLAGMRTKGVALRNEGLKLRDKRLVPNWTKKAVKWETSIKAEIHSLSPAQAEVFDTLDWVSVRSFPTGIPEKAHHRLNMLSDQLKNLKELIERLDPIFTGTTNPDA